MSANRRNRRGGAGWGAYFRGAGAGLRSVLTRARVNTLWLCRASWRYFLSALPYAALALCGMMLPVAVVLGVRHVQRAPDFRVQHVTVGGNERVTPEEILRLSGLDASPNLVTLDLDEVATQVRQAPWIRSATVQRELPDKVTIRITEHEPKALIALGALYLVDERAQVFARVEAGEHYALPVITGVERADLAPDAPASRFAAAQNMVRGALRLLGAWRQSDFGKAHPVSEVHADPLFGYAVVLDGEGGEEGTFVQLGFADVGPKLGRLEAILADAVRRGLRLGEVRLDDDRDPDRVAVRFRATPVGGRQEGRGGDVGGRSAAMEEL